MKGFFTFLLASMLFIGSCTTTDKDKSDFVYHINLERDIDNISSLPLSCIGSKLEYIPLETDSSCLIRTISTIAVTDSFIFVGDYYQGVFLFDIKGNFLRQIGFSGRGPGEYSRINDIAVDEESKEVFILDFRQIFVFDFNGHFKRDFELGFPSKQLVLNENNDLVLHPFNLAQPTDKPVYSWYILNKHGKEREKILNTLKRVNSGLAVPNSPLYIYDNTLYFMEFGIDTLYRYKNKEKSPHIVFNYGKFKIPPDPTVEEIHVIDGKFYVSNVLETKKAFFIKIWCLLPTTTISNCIYDKETSKFTVLKDDRFTNDIDDGVPFWPELTINDKMLVGFVDAFDIIKYNQNKVDTGNNQLPSQLNNLKNKLKETSNPVIIILK